MSTGYVTELVAICKDLGIYVPDNIRNDQTQTKYLLTLIQTAIDSDQARNATGNAVAGDVAKDKTFSSAAGVGLVGTYVAPTLASQTADADATEADILEGKTAYVNGVKITGTHAAV